jgi:hypothetical protein
MKDGSPVRILDATDEQFEVFIREVGMPVKAGAEGEKWSFDNRCRAINYALKHGLCLPFADVSGMKNNSVDERKTYPPQKDMTARHFQNAVSVFELEKQMRAQDEHPLEPVASSVDGRDYPDLEEGE